MSAKWTSNGTSNREAPPQAPLNDIAAGFVVLLLYGKNSFGDKIYSYVKVHMPNLPRLKTAILAGKGFTPSDFGEVVAAGRGEPTAEVRAEIASLYSVMDNNKLPPKPPVSMQPEEKKNWDEY